MSDPIWNPDAETSPDGVAITSFAGIELRYKPWTVKLYDPYGTFELLFPGGVIDQVMPDVEE